MWTEIKPESRFQVGYLRVSDLFYFRDSKIQNLTRRGRVSGDGSTEPHLCFRPFPGENANESLPAYQNEHLRVFVLFLFWGHDHIGNSGVGNAVLGVPQVLCTCKPYQTATFGGRNAGDGVPYGCLSF